MAIQNASVSEVSTNGRVRLVTWENLQVGDTGAAAEWVEYADRCFQVVGAFGVGGACTIQGSNDGVNWSALSDPQGNALTFSSQHIEQALELPRFVRPIVTGGDATTSLTVILCMRS